MTVENKQEVTKAEEMKLDVQEDITAIFSGEGLSEEFKSNAKAIFEAAILAKVSEERAKLDEEYAIKLNEEINSINESMITKVDEYLEYVVNEWMEENKLAVESGIKAELAEDFMVGLKNLFTEHYVDIPEEKLDVIEEIAEKLQELEIELDKVVTENVQMTFEINEYRKENIVNKISEGLTDVQSAKLKSLAEGIEYVSDEDYEQKLTLTKKKYFDSKIEEQVAPKSNSLDGDGAVNLDESFAPAMNHYVQSISKIVKR